jgi:hypothetical protein
MAESCSFGQRNQKPPDARPQADNRLHGASNHPLNPDLFVQRAAGDIDMSLPNTLTDRELLELSAKAAGVSVNDLESECEWDTGRCIRAGWNPLESDTDALRLAVTLGTKYPCVALSIGGNQSACEFNFVSHGDDPYKATRRAIVIAAANLGRLETT